MSSLYILRNLYGNCITNIKIFIFVLTNVLLSANAYCSDFNSEYIKIIPENYGALRIDGCTVPLKKYDISKYELTNTEYAAFLNAVARVSDPFGLYSPLQEQHFWGGIVKHTVGANAVYKIKKGYENFPVTFLSWFDAVRYINWLHFGRPDNGASVLGTTEGNDVQGAYDTTALNSQTPSKSRNKAARYYLPTCGEWIYAGFYDPKTHLLTRYVGGDSLPESGPPNRNVRTANYYFEDWANPFPHLASVKSYANNQSPLGTFNQAGNVMEWVETNGKMAMGGSLFLPADTLSLQYRDSEHPSKKLNFRSSCRPR